LPWLSFACARTKTRSFFLRLALPALGEGQGCISRCNHDQRREDNMTDQRLADLRQFTGSEEWYRHPLNPAITYTQGARYVADQVGAHWLLDEIALAQLGIAAVKVEPFQVWKLDVKASRATLSCEDGNNANIFTKDITFTDFPEPGVTLWFTDNVILLPSEY
jgi:hypothetical protein